MNLKCGYFAVGGIMCGSLVGIFIGALAVNASLGYMILLLGAWGLCLYITSRSLMDDARREEAVLNQPAEEFDNPDELPSLYWEGYDRGYEDALESMAYTRPPRVRPPKSKKKVLSLTTPPAGRCPHLNAAAWMGAGLKPRQMQREEGVFL